MCDDIEEFEEIDAEYGEDYIDYDAPPPGRIKYRQADKPYPIEDRLEYFKYDKQYEKSVRELLQYFCPDLTTNKKPKVLLLRFDEESYVFVPVEAIHEQPIASMGWMGMTMSYPASAPTFTLTTRLFHKDERKLWAKYHALTETVFRGEDLRPVNICGMMFYLSDMDAQFGTEKHSRDTITIKFTAVTDCKYGQHRRLRQYEQNIRKQFGKFLKCESNH